MIRVEIAAEEVRPHCRGQRRMPGHRVHASASNAIELKAIPATLSTAIIAAVMPITARVRRSARVEFAV
jgi:hypothetical protein